MWLDLTRILIPAVFLWNTFVCLLYEIMDWGSSGVLFHRDLFGTSLTLWIVMMSVRHYFLMTTLLRVSLLFWLYFDLIWKKTHNLLSSAYFIPLPSIDGEYVPVEGDEVTYKVCRVPPKNLKVQAVEVKIVHLNPGTKHETWSGQVISS